VITSATGAAVRDVLSVLGRRFALAAVEVLPVPVQGREAPPAIVAMLGRAAASGRYDVLLLTRGGGSLEDLGAFNDEAVARAIHASAVPVVSAVGHEVDFSIADFVADLRAPTPSAAAELLVPDTHALQRQLAQQRERLRSLAARRLQNAGQRLDHAVARLQAQRPQARLAQGDERLRARPARLSRVAQALAQGRSLRLAHVRARLLAQHPHRRLALLGHALREQHRQLQAGMTRRLQRDHLTLAQSARALHAVSPLATLERGYAILFDADGAVVRSATAVAPDAKLTARLSDGTLNLRRTDKPV
jgi:exodeoxyribonuclease VII large subunit